MSSSASAFLAGLSIGTVGTVVTQKVISSPTPEMSPAVARAWGVVLSLLLLLVVVAMIYYTMGDDTSPV